MNVNQMKDTVKIGYEAKRSVLILGAPGVGKSAGVYQASEELGGKHNCKFGVIEIRGASSSPQDLADIKYVLDGTVKSAMQGWIPTDEKIMAGECPERGTIFLDEIGDSLPSVQSTLQRLGLDHKLGSAELGAGWETVMASNRQKDKTAAGRLSNALVNRCITITIEPDADEWFDWGISNDIYHPILAFVRFRPDCLNDFDPSRKAENPAFCSPRSMEILSDAAKVWREFKTPESLQMEITNGTIGDGRGSEFSGFLRIQNDLPDLNGIINDPKKYPVPEKMDVLYATVYALINRLTEKNTGAILTFFTRMNTEMAFVAVKDTVKIKPEVTKTETFRKWAAKNTKFIG